MISAIVFVGRALSIPAMYLFVRHHDDVNNAMLVNTLVPLLSGITICFYLYLRRELDFVHVSLKTIIERLKDGRVRSHLPRHVREVWPSYSLDRKRAILRAVIDRIEIHPQSGPVFDPSAIHLKMKAWS